ncbi:MAG TPA: hypothetical protein VGP26_09900 [Actinophytocola sp.]|jgi:hypothetical protein|nr:hypothetical protein [Actinophytocola sp.]
MRLFGSNGRHRKKASIGLAALVGAAGIAAAAIAISTGTSAAAESCGGLDTALQNNLNFIAAQQAAPDAQSQARIANRLAVVDQIQQRRQAAGCTGDVVAQPVNTDGSGESCAGLDTALRNNLNFIAAQQAAPDAQSQAPHRQPAGGRRPDPATPRGGRLRRLTPGGRAFRSRRNEIRQPPPARCRSHRAGPTRSGGRTRRRAR